MQSIYAHHVLHGLASFEEEAPSVDELERRYRDVLNRGLPYLVAELDGAIAGSDTVRRTARAAPTASRSRTRFMCATT